MSKENAHRKAVGYVEMQLQKQLFHKLEYPKSFRDSIFGSRGYKTFKITIEEIDSQDANSNSWFTYKHPDRFDDFTEKLWDLIRLEDDLLKSIKVRDLVPDALADEDLTTWHVYYNKLGGGRSRGPSEKTKVILDDWCRTQEDYERIRSDNKRETKLTIRQFVEGRLDKYPDLTIDKMKYYLRAHSDYCDEKMRIFKK